MVGGTAGLALGYILHRQVVNPKIRQTLLEVSIWLLLFIFLLYMLQPSIQFVRE